MHPIKRYCERHDLTQAEFATRVGLSAPFVSEVIRGVYRLGRDGARKVVNATRGELSFDALLGWDPESLSVRSPGNTPTQRGKNQGGTNGVESRPR